MRVLVIASDIAIMASVMETHAQTAPETFKQRIEEQFGDDVYEIIMPLQEHLVELFIPYQKPEKQFYEHKFQYKLPPFNHKPKNELKKQAYIFLKEKEC